MPHSFIHDITAIANHNHPINSWR